MDRLDIGIAGCGIAGMAAALLLARQGHRVRIYERFEEPRPIGSGLMIQPTGLAVLARLGLDAAVRQAGARVTRLLGLASPGGRTALDVRYDWLKQPGACGYGIHRSALFAILHDALVEAGIDVLGCRTTVGTELAGDGQRRLIFDDDQQSPPHDLIIDALGAMSPLSTRPARPLPYGALWASLAAVPGFAPDVLEQRYRRASRMCGVLPIGTGGGRGGTQVAFFWSLRGDRLDQWRQAGLAAWKEEVLELWPEAAPLLDQISSADQLTFARYAHRTLRRPAEPALIHIGDAWHSTSPQLGQGANMALLDAWALADAIDRSDHFDDALRRAVAARRNHVRLYQLLSRLFTPAYQSDGALLPFARDRIVPPFARRWPGTRIQAEMVAGTFGGPLRKLGLG